MHVCGLKAINAIREGEATHSKSEIISFAVAIILGSIGAMIAAFGAYSFGGGAINAFSLFGLLEIVCLAGTFTPNFLAIRRSLRNKDQEMVELNKETPGFISTDIEESWEITILNCGNSFTKQNELSEELPYSFSLRPQLYLRDKFIFWHFPTHDISKFQIYFERKNKKNFLILKNNKMSGPGGSHIELPHDVDKRDIFVNVIPHEHRCESTIIIGLRKMRPLPEIPSITGYFYYPLELSENPSAFAIKPSDHEENFSLDNFDKELVTKENELFLVLKKKNKEFKGCVIPLGKQNPSTIKEMTLNGVTLAL